MRKTLLAMSLFAVVLLSAIPVKAQDDFEQVFDYVDNYFKDKLGGLIFPHNPIGKSAWRRSTKELSRYNRITYENMDILATTIKNFNPNVPTEPPDIKPYEYQSINDALKTFLNPYMRSAYRTLNQLQETFQGKMNAVGDRLEEFRATARNEHYDKEAHAQKVTENEVYGKGEDAEIISANNAPMQEEPANGYAGEPESVHAGSKYWYDPNDKDHFVNVVDEDNTYHRMSLEDAVDKGFVPEGTTIEDMTHYNNAKDSFENDVNTSDRFGNRQDRIDSTTYPDGNGMQTDTDGASNNYENMHASNINDEFQNELNNVNGNQNLVEKTPVEDKQHSSSAVDDEFQNELNTVAGSHNSSDKTNDTFEKEVSGVVSLREEEAEREMVAEMEAAAAREAEAERARDAEAVRVAAAERESEAVRAAAEYQRYTQDMQALRDAEAQSLANQNKRNAKSRRNSDSNWASALGSALTNTGSAVLSGIAAKKQAKYDAQIAYREAENQRIQAESRRKAAAYQASYQNYQQETQDRIYREEEDAKKAVEASKEKDRKKREAKSRADEMLRCAVCEVEKGENWHKVHVSFGDFHFSNAYQTEAECYEACEKWIQWHYRDELLKVNGP